MGMEYRKPKAARTRRCRRHHRILLTQPLMTLSRQLRLYQLQPIRSSAKSHMLTHALSEGGRLHRLQFTPQLQSQLPMLDCETCRGLQNVLKKEARTVAARQKRWSGISMLRVP
jgi:hypothetical protein